MKNFNILGVHGKIQLLVGGGRGGRETDSRETDLEGGLDSFQI